MRSHLVPKLVSVLTLMSGMILSPECLAATQPWGTALGSFSGVVNYSDNPASMPSPQPSSYVSGYYMGLEWECVEYVRRYYYTIYSKNLYSLGGSMNAWQFYGNAASMQLTAYANGGTAAPQVGDILCFNQTSSGLGHVAIIRAVGSSTVTVIQQNVKNGDTGPNGTDDNYSFAYNPSTQVVDVLTAGSSHLGTTFYCQGWLRPAASGQPDLTITGAVTVSPTTISSGGTIRVDWTEKNIGTAASSPAHNTKIYLATTTYGTTYNVGYYGPMNTLAVGASHSYYDSAIVVPTSIPAGTYYVTAFVDCDLKVTELSDGNNIGSSTPNMITVTTSDTTPPTVSITSPTSGTTYTTPQTVNIIAAASDNVGLSHVDFYDDSTLKASNPMGPYVAPWAFTSADNGTHNWTARAYDTSGNMTISSVVSLTVNIPVNISVTVQPSPSGRTFTVDGTSYSTAQTFTWVSGSSHTIAGVTPQSGGTGIQYLWSSWSDSGTISHTVAPTAATTYTAYYTTQYALTTGYGTGGASVSPASAWYNSGSSVGISATAASGYSFSSWTGSGTGSYSGSTAAPTITMNGPISEMANFTVNPVNISVTVQPSPSGRTFTVDGTSYSTAQTFTWVSGSTHTIAGVTPQSGGTGIQYVWSSWSDSGTISHTVTPTTATTYTANYTTQYALTTGYGTGGAGASPASGWYNSGSSVGISATAASGYSFSSWTGSGSGSYTGSGQFSSVTMNGPITETASFTFIAALPGSVVAWGDSTLGQCNVPWGLTNVVAFAAGYHHSLALKADGAVVGWGENNFLQTNVPSGLSNVKAIAAGWGTSLALVGDGTVKAWGWDAGYGITNTANSLANITAVSACWDCLMALKGDNTVFVWGHSTHGETNVPAGLTDVSAVSGGGYFCMALKRDGTVVTWGSNLYGQTNTPANLSGVKAIAAGGDHCLALKSNGTVVAWGLGTSGQTNVPPDLTNAVAVSAGGFHSLALRADGTLVAWGLGSSGQTNIPSYLRGVTAISAGGYHNLGNGLH